MIDEMNVRFSRKDSFWWKSLASGGYHLQFMPYYTWAAMHVVVETTRLTKATSTWSNLSVVQEPKLDQRSQKPLACAT